MAGVSKFFRGRQCSEQWSCGNVLIFCFDSTFYVMKCGKQIIRNHVFIKCGKNDLKFDGTCCFFFLPFVLRPFARTAAPAGGRAGRAGREG